VLQPGQYVSFVPEALQDVLIASSTNHFEGDLPSDWSILAGEKHLAHTTLAEPFSNPVWADHRRVGAVGF
jgi:hypothetical protein